ncbi:Predicted dehydrogenase [Nakamurella panacisegetis]|uniref:Predicted dehydrogenase n=1 Tax=Nakamurella panacisegetis TaxID=1090615 RepID=A0A1H0LVC4_9ACTN|nr:Gfo/Idh/MocA family oxidoreductase [Nakamurella panacisegetis]SDO72075.1 Predicted dehydrogenase [Nakamurella panacisegetis]
MTGSGPLAVGVIGAGKISEQYLANMATYPDLDVRFVADLYPDLARSRAQEFGVAAAGSVEDALARDDLELIVNLTIPVAHASVASAALASGKHVWNEKPITARWDEAGALLVQADAAGLLIGTAPDTFLGPGLQVARTMIERGDIGTPLTATIAFQSAGPHRWHPNPDFLYQAGGGPLFDMAPYYLTALAQMFGPIVKVAALGSSAGPTRVIGEGPRAGQSFDVTVPTSVSALYEFAGGLKAQAIFSFDSPLQRVGILEISGTDAMIAPPDPNRFTGDIRLVTAESTEEKLIPAGERPAGRGIGVVDMARAIRGGSSYGPHRASGALATHVLEAMFATAASIDTGAFVPVASTFAPVPVLPDGWDPSVRTV